MNQLDVTPSNLAQAAEACAKVPDRWPARLAELTDHLLAEIHASGAVLDPQQQRALAMRQVARLCQTYGGDRATWPKPDLIARALRDATIWSEHDGTVDGPRGVLALAKRHHLSDRQIMRILCDQRALRKK